MDRPIDEDIIGWILEFILRSTSDEGLQKELMYALSSSNSRICSRLAKTIALRSIEYEIEDASVSERILENIEIIDELDRSQGLSIMDSMKKAYCAVAVECTVKYLASSSNRNGKYFEAIKRIWRGRIGNLENLKISKLLTDDLIASKEEVEAAMWDEHICSRLTDRNTRNAALFSVRDYLEEALPLMGPTILEMGSRLMRSVRGDHLLPRVSIQEGSRCVADERDEAGKEKERTTSANPLPEALREDEAIALEMARKNASGEVVDVEEGTIEADGAKEVGIREAGGANEVGIRMQSSCHPNTSKRSLMERNSTARVFEWDDSSDGDDSSGGRSKHIRSSSPKSRDVSPMKKRKSSNFAKGRKARRGTSTVVSPLKEQQLPKSVRKRRRWSSQEEEALRDGVQKYGVGSWKMILKSNHNAFQERTEVDLKDKWRNLTK